MQKTKLQNSSAGIPGLSGDEDGPAVHPGILDSDLRDSSAAASQLAEPGGCRTSR